MVATTVSSQALISSRRSSFNSNAVSRPQKVTRAMRPKALAVRADGGYLGSPTNLVMVANIAATMAMGRFKFSPLGVIVPGTKKEEYAAAVAGNDPSYTPEPAGFGGAQMLAFASLGHLHGVGMVLGMKVLGML